MQEKKRVPALGMKRTHTAGGADVEYLREGCGGPYASKLKTLNVMGKNLKKKCASY